MSRHTHPRPVTVPQLFTLLLTFCGVSALIGVLGAGMLVPVVGPGAVAAKTVPSVFDELPTDFTTVHPAEESQMLDANGNVIARFFDKRRIVVPSDKIADVMKNAIVAIEDKRFFEHTGVDPEGMARALVNNLSDTGGTQGASTITQQFVRNMLQEEGYLNGDEDLITRATEQTTERKLREVKLALSVEKQMTKDDILTGYLNIAPFGPVTYGVEAASQLYFSHSASELTMIEAALLAGLVQSPVEYDPLVHPEAAQERRDTVLLVMHNEGIISDEEYDAAIATPVADMLHPQSESQGCAGADSSVAYFCDFVYQQFLADPAFGETEVEREQLLKTGGLTIRTSLDPTKQAAARDALVNAIPVDDPSDVDDALAAVEPSTGKVLAMAQNTNYGVGEGQTMANYAADGLFQTGSTFKVFTLIQWFKEGHSAYESVGRSNRVYNSGEFKCDGKSIITERYPVEDLPGKDGVFNVIQATGMSINQAFVNMATKVDFCQIFQTAADFGFTKPDGSLYDTVPANIIGSASASPLTAATAFAALENNGQLCSPQSIVQVTDRNENVLKEMQPDCHEVVSPVVAQQVTTLLQKATSTYYTSTKIADGRAFAGKSGTTNDNSNTWLTGYTSQIAASAWVGHAAASSTPVNNVTINGTFYEALYGETFVGHNIWAPFMSAALDGTEDVPLANVNIGSSRSR